jgi:hypothetical protein
VDGKSSGPTFATSGHPDDATVVIQEVTVVRVDITCDLMDEDETGYVRAFLRDARDQALIQPGAIVVADDEDASAVAEVVDIVDKPADRVVHLRILPGLLEDYQAVIQRAVIPV